MREYTLQWCFEEENPTTLRGKSLEKVKSIASKEIGRNFGTHIRSDTVLYYILMFYNQKGRFTSIEQPDAKIVEDCIVECEEDEYGDDDFWYADCEDKDCDSESVSSFSSLSSMDFSEFDDY